MKPGETDTNLKTVYFEIYDADGLPASGEVDEGAVWSPGVLPNAKLQTNRDLAGYVDAEGTFSHVGSGLYRYTYDDDEIAGTTQGTIVLRAKEAGVIRVQQVITPLIDDGTDALELIQGLLHQNCVLNFTYVNGFMTACRIRQFANAAAANAATAGAADGADGEIHRWRVTAVDNGQAAPSSFKLVKEL